MDNIKEDSLNDLNSHFSLQAMMAGFHFSFHYSSIFCYGKL